MDTPICDFVRRYSESDTLRLHMPGHKGKGCLGFESLDITEISGADSLYEAEGIIAKSEANASALFGSLTFYSTEGSSQCIRAMLYLISQYAKQMGKEPLIAAGRNVHKSFLTAAGLLDVNVCWLYPKKSESYLSCNISAKELGEYLENTEQKPVAVYLTSPDYLGTIADIKGIAEVCHRYGVLLTVDNAHGAYLKFLPESVHPIDLGADICCDSAHKTLPVLTGGAYLHLAPSVESVVGDRVRNALMLFGSTSPSYLILQSLDAANLYLADYAEHLKKLLPTVFELKNRLEKVGYTLYGNEPLKLTVYAKPYGYRGVDLADHLRKKGIEPEFADPDHLVLMLSAYMDEGMIEKIFEALCSIPALPPVSEKSPFFERAERVMSIREAMLTSSEMLPIKECVDRVLAVPAVGCPPAVPILVCGEKIDKNSLSCFDYYGIDRCCVVKE